MKNLEKMDSQRKQVDQEERSEKSKLMETNRRKTGKGEGEGEWEGAVEG